MGVPFTLYLSRSPVFRASMLSNMEEGIKAEMFIPDIDEKSLDTVIGFVYTGQLKMSEDIDLLIKGMKDQFDSMREDYDLQLNEIESEFDRERQAILERNKLEIEQLF